VLKIRYDTDSLYLRAPKSWQSQLNLLHGTKKIVMKKTNTKKRDAQKKRSSDKALLRICGKMLIFAALERWLIQIRETVSSFVYNICCFRRPFIKRLTVRPMLSDRCLSCLSVSLVYWLAKELDGSRCHLVLGTEIGLSPGDIVLDGDPGTTSTPKGQSSPHFLAHAYCRQTAGWIKMPLGRVVDLGPGHVTHLYSPNSVAHNM